jgi:hypothetical protein
MEKRANVPKPRHDNAVERVLKQAQGILPERVEIVLLADRGFGDGKLMKYLRENLGWYFRIRIKSTFYFQGYGKWKKVSGVKLAKGEAYFTKTVSQNSLY